ncbi:CRE-SMC-4 protein [Caenorhabditis remanei]|uniref:CRE-SMC-4 protein n=1 Tax=Caenorhabditis remanei TaxID=31234 RepID=E3MCX0_CAERE|nr:CRE-SMC-4 protein [Caenorhabditis remanei]
MPPKKSTGPPPQSDESGSDFEEEPARKPQKKPSKSSKPSKFSKQEKEKELDPEEALKRAADTIFDGSEGEDDDSDLFALEIPPRPDFLVRPNKKDRLMILNVEVNNFKSYYGKASIGPFHKSFTSIIGPNGSGKSNLIDSLLFVFGFRASKIRSAKVANLIHKSAGREPDSCTVTIHFQRIVDVPGHYEVVKDSLFDISRTAYRNSSSSYAINGRPASKNEVEARLRLVDIDIEHNRFLILQGEVEQIAMMKPVKTTKSETGMVEYLEDIIGSNRLERFVKKFQRRVNRLNCDLSQQRIARDHARNSKIAMEGQVRTAIEFLNKENEAKTIEMKLNQRRKKKYKDRAAPKQAELDKQKEEMKEIAAKLDENKSESKSAEDEEKKLSKDRLKIEKEIDQLTKEIDDLSAEETRRRETIKRYETDISKTEAEKDKEQKKRATFVSVPEKAEKKLAKWKEEVEQLIETEDTANAAADNNLEEFEKRAEKLKEEQKKAQEAWSKSNTAFISARSEATVARNEYEDMNKMANSGSKKLDQLKERLKTTEEKFIKEKEEIEKLRPEVDSWNEKLRNLKTSLPTVREEAKTTNLALNQCQERLDVLRQQNSSGSGGSHLVKMLMKEKQEGRIPSFIGRLGDLGLIDKKYEGAICTNYGAILNNLITGTSDDSKKIMNFLYKNKLPRTTIQSLDRVPQVRAEDMAPVPKDRYPGPRLFDLIECEPEVRHIYYRTVRNAVVAESTTEALKMNKMSSCKNVNIVTLQGAMVQSSGSITGGGQTLKGFILTDKNKKPKEVTAEDRRAEKELTVEVAQLQTKSDELREQEHKLDAQLIEARRKVHELEQRLSIVTATVDSEGENIKSLRKAVENQEKEASKVKVDAKELEAKKKLAEEFEKKQDELSEEAEITRKRQAEVQSKLDGIFKELVQCHRDEAKDASTKRAKLEKDMAKETANVTNSGRNIAKCDENIVRMEKEIEKKKQMCIDLEEKAIDGEGLEGKKSALEEVEKKKTDVETQYKDIMKKQSELSDAETKLEEELRKCNEVIMELKEKMNADTMKVKEIQKKVGHVGLVYILSNDI